MNRRIVLAALVSAVALVAQSAEAQRRGGRRMPVIDATPAPSVSPYGGYMMFGRIATGPLGTRLSNSSGAVYGVQANLPVGSTLSVVGNLAYSEPDLRFGVPILGGITFGKSQVLMYDAGLQFSAPTMRGERAIVPFVQVGAGVMRYNVDVAGFRRSATNIAFNAGLGMDLPIAQNIALRVFAKDYIGKFDVYEAAGVNYKAKTSNNVALTAGLKLQF